MNSPLYRGFSAAAFVLALATRAPGQELELVVFGGPNHGLGKSVAGMADVNGDAVPDLVVGADVLGGGQRGGFVAVASGADGSILLGPAVTFFGSNLGWAVACAGDFDGDGQDDYLAGDIQEEEVQVLSGVDGHRIVTISSLLPDPLLHFGSRVAGMGDINLDGCDDVAVVPNGGNYVAIFGGPKGGLIRRHWAGKLSHVTSLGDLDGDGSPDYALGAPDWFFGLDHPGLVEIYSGITGELMYRIVGSDNDYFGVVAPLSDVDGDSIPDWATGASQTSHDWPWIGCGQLKNFGYLSVRSGADGHEIRRVDSPSGAEEAFGRVVVGGGDLNGDGAWDLIVGSPCLVASPLRVYSGRTGTQLWTIRADEFPLFPGTRLYDAVAIVGDLNGDGCAEFAIGDEFAEQGGTHAGAVYVMRGAPGDAEPLCVTSPNSIGNGAILRTKGSISVGDQDLVLSVDGLPPGELGQFVYGPELVNVPYGDGILCVGGGNLGIVHLDKPRPIDALGHAELAIDYNKLPTGGGPAAWRPGTTWIVQYVYRDWGGPGGTGMNASDALRITLNP